MREHEADGRIDKWRFLIRSGGYTNWKLLPAIYSRTRTGHSRSPLAERQFSVFQQTNLFSPERSTQLILGATNQYKAVFTPQFSI